MINLEVTLEEFYQIEDALRSRDDALRRGSSEFYYYLSPAKRNKLYDDAFKLTKLVAKLNRQVK